MYRLPVPQQARVWGTTPGGLLLLRRSLTASFSAPVTTATGAGPRLSRSLAPTRPSPMELVPRRTTVRCASTTAFDPTQAQKKAATEATAASSPGAANHRTGNNVDDRTSTNPFTLSTSTDTSTGQAASAATTEGPLSVYAPWEVRAVVLPLLPTAPPGITGAGTTTADELLMTRLSTFPRALEVQLPKALRSFLLHKERVASAAAAAASAGTAPPSPSPAPADAAAPASKGTPTALAIDVPFVSYMLRHFPSDVALLPSGHLVRLDTAASSRAATPSADPAAPAEHTAPPSSQATTPFDTSLPPSAPASSSPPPSLAACVDKMAPPPPPQQLQSGGTRYGAALGTPPPPTNTSSTVRAGAAAPAAGPSRSGDDAAQPMTHSSSAHRPPPPPVPSEGLAASSSVDGARVPPPSQLHSVPQMMDALAPYLPTFFVHVDAVEPTIPNELKQLYGDTSFRFFLKRFRHYVDIRAAHNSVEVRLRADFDHPKRGAADARHTVGGMMAGAGADSMVFRRPPRNSEANLISYAAPQVPKEYTPLADVLQELAPIISRHPAFDPRLGVMGLLGKYPEYFQVAHNKLRARPYDVAPNALDSLDEKTSPFPLIFARVLQCVNAAAQGKNFAVAEEKAAAAVSTGRLYALLTAAEKNTVKKVCRSFPTFLRLHGKCIVVSVDKMKVHQFQPPYEACVDTLADERLRMNSLRPDDPVLQIPAEMPADSNAEWAVRALYDALPLMQCAELGEVLSLVPPAVRDALPRDVAEVQSVLQQYPDSFTTWRYPDDETVIVIQRARVEAPALEKADVVRMVLPLIPQGGTMLSSLRTRVPLVLQRYFYHHGTVATLSSMTDVFAISGDRIVRMV